MPTIEEMKKKSVTLKRLKKALLKKFWGTGKGFKAIDDLKKSQKKKLKIMKEIEGSKGVAGVRG